MGLDINLNTSKIDISEEDGLNVDLYNDNIDISDDEADDIIIEITGLKSINKFIGLEDTPLYYDNGKFFKVEDNKIVYADIQWKDISGDISESPEIVAVISDLVNEVASDIIDERINLHNLNEEAHPYIQNIIKQNYDTLDAKIDNTKEELSEALNTEIINRETADNELSENIQQETLARIEADTTLQNNINSVASDLSDEISARESADTTLSNSISDLSDGLIQEITDRQTADTGLQSQITSNYNTLDSKIDSVESSLNDLSDTVDANDTAINNKVDNINNTLTNSISTLSDTVSNNYTTLDNKIDSVEGALANSITALDNKYDSITSGLGDEIDSVEGALNTHISNTSNPHNVTKAQVGLGNVDNTSDLNKPISTATQSALDGKVPNTRTINNKALSSDITLTYTDVNALPDTTTINDLTTATQQNALNSGINSTLTQQITTNQNNISNLTSTVSSNYTTLDNRITSEVNTLNSSISDEETARINADNGLQSQIDAITSASDVTDIVGTYAELQAYDTTSLPDKSIIKVLQDESRNGETTYYRWVITNGTGAWILIGEEGPYYTKSEADGRFVTQTTTINNKALSSNITLTASDVGALPDSTVIGNGTLTIQKNSTTIDTFDANATSNKTININVPTDTSDLSNNAGFISGITSSDVTNALGYTPENINNKVTSLSSSNTDTQYPSAKLVYNELNDKQETLVSGTNIKTVNNESLLGSGNITIDSLPSQSGQSGKFLTTNGTTASWSTISMPTNYVTTDTVQNITGEKTFVGDKRIKFKQATTADKLGFTLYNTSNTELAAFEFRPSTIGSSALFNLNLLKASTNYVGFRYHGTNAINVACPKVATAGNYYIPINFTNGTNTVTSNNVGTVNISTLLPDVSNYVTNSSLATILSDYVLSSDLSTTLANYVTSANLTTILGDYATQQWVNNQGFALSSNLATVATSGSYNDLADKPYIPSGVVVDQTFDGTSQNAQSGVAIAGELNNYVKSSAEDAEQGITSSIGYLEGYAPVLQMTQGNYRFIVGCAEGATLATIDNTTGNQVILATTPDRVVMLHNNQQASLTLSSNNNLMVNGSEVALQSDIPDISTKQDTLVSGTNIKTINNNSLLGSGNITIDSLPSQSGQNGKFLTTNGTTASWSTISIPTVDQTFDGTSQNAQSGVAISNAKFIRNTATGSSSITILGTATSGIGATNIGYDAEASIDFATALGYDAKASNLHSVALGTGANASGYVSIALGHHAIASESSAIQIGYGTNSTAKTLNIGFYENNTNWQLLDGTTGLIPDARISTNIARVSQIPDVLTDDTTVNKNSDDELQTIGVIDDNVQNAYNFTVVGSPKITDDGIASGFSNNNYLKRVKTLDFNKPFIINAEFVTGKPDNMEQCLFHFKNLNSFTFRIHSDNKFILYYPTSTGQQFRFGSVALSNTKYFLEIEYDLTKLTAKLGLSKDNMQTFAEITNADFSLTQSDSLLLGITLSSNRYWKGSIDLKQFSITVDGVEVYKAWQPPAIKYWTGTKAEYDAISSYDTTTLYNIEGVGLYKGTTLISNDGANKDLSNLSTTGQAVIDGKASTDLSNLSTTGQAVIDGKADTDLSNLSSTGQAVIDAKVNNDDYYYKSGDTDSYFWFGGGYISASATEIAFTLPTPKSMANITTVTCTALTTAFRKSNGGYMPSSGGNVWNAKANATVTISKQTEKTLYVSVKYNNWGGTNNTPVGVWASISLSFT